MTSINPRGKGRRRTSAASAQGKGPGQNLDESPLSWLRRRRGKAGEPLISETQFSAGERLRADFTIAAMTPRVTVNWGAAGAPSGGRRGAPGAGVELADRVAGAQERVRLALAAVGPGHAGILIDVCCHLKGLEETERQAGWPPRSARVVLLLALDALARHYGLDKPAGRPGAIRHWGDEGYVPT